MKHVKLKKILAVIFVATIFFGYIPDIILFSSNPSTGAVNLAPKSFFVTQETVLTISDDLDIDKQNSLAVKLLLLALEKMNKQNSVLYKKLTAPVEKISHEKFDSNAHISDFLQMAKECTYSQQVELMGLYVRLNGGNLYRRFEGLNWKELDSEARKLAIATLKFSVKTRITNTIFYFEKFGLDVNKPQDKVAVVEIAKLAAQENVFDTVGLLHKFNFDISKEIDRDAVIDILKICAQRNAEECLSALKKFGLAEIKDKTAIIEIAKICAQQNPKATLWNIDGLGLDPAQSSDKAAIVEIAKICMTEDPRETLYNFYKFGLDGSRESDKDAVIEIAKLAALNSGDTPLMFTRFGLDVRKDSDRKAVIEIAKLCATKNASAVGRHIKEFGLGTASDKNRDIVLDILEICVTTDPIATFTHVKNFGLDLSNLDDKKIMIDIVKATAKNNATYLLQHFHEIGLDTTDDADRKSILEIAKLCVIQNSEITSAWFDNLGLGALRDDEVDIVVEIAKICAKKNGGKTVFDFSNFKLNGAKDSHKEGVIQIAKICAEQNAEETVQSFKKFGLDGNKDTDKEAVLEIAKICAKQNTAETILHFKNFGFDGRNVSDKAAVIEIAKICAEEYIGNPAFLFDTVGLSIADDRLIYIDLLKILAVNNPAQTAYYFAEIGLDVAKKEDKAVVVALAKQCATKQTEATLETFKQFGLDIIRDRDEIVEIAKICAEQNGKATIKYFHKFGFDVRKASDKEVIVEIAKICALDMSIVTEKDLELFDLDFTENSPNINLLRLFLNNKHIMWNRKHLEAINEFIKDGLLNANDISIENIYILLRTHKLISPEDIPRELLHGGDRENEKVRTTNLELMAKEDMLIDHNNRAIKFLGVGELDKDNALLAISETEQMFKIYNEMFVVDLPEIGKFLAEIKEKVLHNQEDVLSDGNARLLREITGSLTSLQDIIVYLHQNSIRKLFSQFTSETKNFGTQFSFKAGITKFKAVDILNLKSKEIYYSGVKFLQDFYRNRKKILKGMQTIVADKTLYHFFKLGVHTAKIAIDLHAPVTGGNLLFEYNENQYDMARREKVSDIYGNQIRQLVVEEVLNRNGLKVDSEGLNVHAIANKETGSQTIEDLTNLYEKIYYLLYILAEKNFSLYGKTYFFGDTDFGDEYRKRKDPQLFPDMALVKNMVQEKATLIERLINQLIDEKKADDQEFVKSYGFAKPGLSVMESLEELYQQQQPKTNTYQYLQDIFEKDSVFLESRNIAQSLSSIKDLFVWENDMLIGRYKIIKTEVEIGYKDKDILYALEDKETGEMLLGWMVRGVTKDTVYSYDEFVQRVGKKGMYPLSKGAFPIKMHGNTQADILQGFAKKLDVDKDSKSGLEEKITTNGLSVSSGVTEGEIIFYRRGQHGLRDLSGKIVVVDNLRPEDDSYIKDAKGLVILKGGALSHGAIFAREMGIPAIILSEFNIVNGILQGNSSIQEQGKDTVVSIGDANAILSSFQTVKKDWNLLEGDIVHLDAEKASLSSLAINKQNLIREIDKEAIDVSNIAEVAKSDNLEKWLYDIAYAKQKKDLLAYLETINPEFKTYGKLLREEALNQKLQTIENIMFDIEQTDTKWKIYNILADLEKLLLDFTVSDRKQYERKIVKILEEKNLYDEPESIKSQQEEVKDYYDLEEVDESLLGVLGNKVSKLGGDTIKIVKAAGGKVPPGIGINGELSKLFFDIKYQGLALKDIIADILNSSASIYEKSHKIQKILESKKLKRSKEYKDLENRIAEIYNMKWGHFDIPVAVRSSAIRKGKQLEDTVGTAGLYKSFMFVERKDFSSRVIDVWKSLYSEEALIYYSNVMKETDWDNLVKDLQMGVVGQEMVNSDVSVVAFSSNPISGADEIIITAGYGQGEGVVSGTVPVDTIVVDKTTGKVISEDIVKKDEMLVRVQGEKELQKAQVLDSKISKPALTEKEIHQIVTIVKDISYGYDNPQDIEIAVKEGVINVVQRRMITTLGIDSGKEYFNKLIRLDMQEKIKNQAIIIKKNYPSLSFGEFLVHITYALSDTTESMIDEEMLHFIEKQWRNFNLVSPRKILITGKSSKLIKQAA